MNKRFVLDASALLASAPKEHCIEVVKPILKFSVISTVNLAESLTSLQRWNITAGEAWELIGGMIPNIVSFDVEQANLLSKLQPSVKHRAYLLEIFHVLLLE